MSYLLRIGSLSGVILMAAGCRTSPRSSVAPGDPIAVTISLYQVPDSAIDTYKLNVQMGLCAESTGTKVDATTYKFMVPNMAPETTCQIRLVGAKSAVSGVQFFTNNDGLYYKDDQVTIKQDTKGALVGGAYVQALFSTPPAVDPIPKPTVWQIAAPITSKAALVDTCTCKLDCSPALNNFNSLMAKGANPNSGTCSYANPAKPGVSSVQCTKMTLQCGEAFYVGTYPSPVAADATGGKSTILPSIELVPGVPNPDGDVTIDVQIKNSTPTSTPTPKP